FTPSQAGTYRWKASYSGDTNNAAIATACNDPGETSVVNQATPVRSEEHTSELQSRGQLVCRVMLAEEIGTLGGTITFTLYGPNYATFGNASIFTNTGAVLNPHSFPTRRSSDLFTPSQAGTYRWKASYSGDTNNAAIATACNDPGETSVVNQATPVLTRSEERRAGKGGSTSGTANHAGGYGNLGGNITFTLYGPNDATCGSAAIFTNTKAVVSSGGDTGTATSDPFRPSQARSYRWKASYSGDTNNAATATACNDPGETSVVNQATPVLTTVATPTSLVTVSIRHPATPARFPYTTLFPTTFTLYGPNDATCGNAAIFTNTKAV